MSLRRAELTAIVMAKVPAPGAVMTRLAATGRLDAATAAEIARTMLRCIVRRLDGLGPVVLAVTPDGEGASLATTIGVPGIPTVDQGRGDLGERMDRVWRMVGADRAVAFFVTDSPDLPDGHLGAVGPMLGHHEAAVGPTGDGGYWTLAARRHLPALLRDIDWGGPSVYDQTCQRALEADVGLGVLPTWFDIDHPADVVALRTRLASIDRGQPGMAGPLGELASRLDALCGPLPPASSP